MDNYDFLLKYQKLQRTVMFDEIIDLGFAKIGLSKTDKTSIWNFALTNKNLKLEQIKLIQAKMNSFDRKTAIYFENRTNLQVLSKFLLRQEYKKDYEDAWMFYERGDLDQSCFDWVKKVEAEEDLKIFYCL